jgi:tetratricopeptide (TPR) repeat protein
MENFMDKRKVAIIAVILFVLGIAIYFYQQNSAHQTEAGKSALYQVQKSFELEMAALPEADRAAGVDFDVDAKFPKTVAGLNELLTKHSAPSSILFEAGFKLGALYLDHGQTVKAVAALKQIPALAKTDFQKASGLYLLGTAQLSANQTQDAVASFEAALTKNVDGLKGEVMLSLVRVHLKLNQKEKAKLYSEKIAKDLPGTAYAKTAEEMTQ